MITVGVRNSTKEGGKKKTLVNLTTVFRKYAWMKKCMRIHILLFKN